MIVAIRYSVDVDRDVRRAINRYHGQPGLATRDDVVAWYYLHGRSMDDDLRDLAARPEDDAQPPT